MARSAEGIPDREVYGDTSKIPLRKLLTYVDQLHRAERAGEHHDIRFGDRDLYSWATRKGMPRPGEKRTFFQQPLHSPQYADFQGKIEEGYGKGTVKTHDRGTAFVTEASPNKIKFVLGHRKNPEYYTLIRTKGPNKPWLIVNHTPQDPAKVVGDRQMFKKKHLGVVPAERVQEVLDGVVEGKIDGASGLFKLKEDSIDVMSFRVGKGDRPIMHTERFFGTKENKFNIPKEFRDRVARGEIYGVDKKGNPIGAQATSPLLNMSLENSLRAQDARGVNLRAALFGFADKPLNYPEREAELTELLKYLPGDKFGRPPVAHNKVDALKLWREIESGKHPETDEGVVAYPKEGKPVKVKLRPDQDVRITDVFPGEGKYRGSAGGIEYEGGGRVGTGFDDAFRKWMWENRDSLKGRIAKITATKKLPSGKYYQPSFVGLHEDYPTKKAEAAPIVGSAEDKEKHKNLPLDILKGVGIHRAVDSGLTYGVRRGGLFQNYYANVAREGMRAAMTGKDVMPRWRRALGIISPNLSGLTDYEVSRGLTYMMKAKLQEQGIPAKAIPKDLNNLLRHPVVQAYHKQLSGKKGLSPLTRNFLNAAKPDLPKNKLVELFKRRGGVGVDRQVNPGLAGGVLAAATGAPHGIAGAASAVLSTSPDLVMAGMAQNPTTLRGLEDLKLGLIGLGSNHDLTAPGKAKALSAGFNIFSPSSAEVYDLGKDLGRLTGMDTASKGTRRKYLQNVDKHMINPAKQVPKNLVSAAGKGVARLLKRGVDFAPDYTPEQLKKLIRKGLKINIAKS